MPGRYPFFELEMRNQPEGVIIRARGALTTDSARAIEEALAVMGVKTNKQDLFIDLQDIFRFEYFAVTKLARTIREQTRRFKNLKISSVEEGIVKVFKTFGIAEHCR